MASDKHSGEAEAAAVADLSEAFGMPVALESFRELTPPSIFIVKGKQPLYRLLVAVEKAGLTWQISKGTLQLKPVDWALRRSWMVPESVMQRYKDLVVKNGCLSFDELGEIAYALTDDQISRTLLAEKELTPVLAPLIQNMPGMGGIPLLRFYGSLSSRQKQALATAPGLPFAQLTPMQYDQLLDLAGGQWGGIEIVSGAITLTKRSPAASAATAQPKAAESATVAQAPASAPSAAPKSKPEEAQKQTAEAAKAEASRQAVGTLSAQDIVTFKFSAEVPADSSESNPRPAARQFTSMIMVPTKASTDAMRQLIANATKDAGAKKTGSPASPAGAAEPK